MRSIFPRRVTAVSVVALALVLSACTGTAGGFGEASLADEVSPISVENGETQPIYDWNERVHETVFVEAPIDSDGDGALDRIALDIARPKTADGVRVAVVMEASPYYGATGSKSSSVSVPLGLRQWYDSFLVPRGYAAVEVEMQGTSRSTGCPTTGGKADTASIVAAIDWLNGRARGFRPDGTEVQATWSTGKVGMMGVSYNGTLPIAVAAEGTPGLQTIVPIGAISSWYDYARDAGIAYAGWDDRYPQYLANFVVSQAASSRCAAVLKELGDDAGDDTFDYTPFWEERDYRKNLDRITASVFVVHGLHDENVKRHNFGRFWDGLAARGVPRKIWLHNEGHTDPVRVRTAEWKDVLHRWMDHWLYGVDNGIMSEPGATIARPDGTWEDRPTWPEPGTADQAFYPSAAGGLASGPASGEATLTEDAPHEELDLVADAATAKPFRLAFLSDTLAAPLRVSGTPRLHVVGHADSASAPLTGILLDLGAATVPVPQNLSFAELVGTSCTLTDLDLGTGCAARAPTVFQSLGFQILTRGSIDLKNRSSLAASTPLTPGETFTAEWELQPLDHVFPVGHRLAVVVAANDKAYVAVDPLAHGITVALDQTRFVLPVAP